MGPSSRSALVGNGAARSMAWRIQNFMQKLGQLLIISNGVICTDQSCQKLLYLLNSKHRLEVVTDFKRGWKTKDNSCTGQGFVDGNGLFPH